MNKKEKIRKEKKKKEKTTKNLTLTNNNKGITLIALVITIIVLLILAGVTINLTLGENGIFKTAEMAGKNYTQAQEDELAGLAGFENTINNVIGGLGNSDTSNQLVTKITLNKTSTTIRKGKTENLTATVEPSNASNKTIKWSSSDNSKVTVENGLITAVDLGTAIITAEAVDGSGVKATCNVVVEEALLKDVVKPGNYVKYDTGIDGIGNNGDGIVLFRVLYNDEANGLQIISDKNVENVALGANGEDDLTAWQATMNDYNNAITILNQKAEYYATSSPYALDGRCVGSMPTVGSDGKFNAKNNEEEGSFIIPDDWTLPSGWSSRDTGCKKGKDENYKADETAMEAIGGNMWVTGEEYWLASRQYSYATTCSFFVSIVSTRGHLYNSLCYVNSSGHTSCGTKLMGLRPCISLKSDVKVVGGDGGEETPYELGV